MIVTVVSDRNRQVRRQYLLLTGEGNAMLNDSLPEWNTQASAVPFRKIARRGIPGEKTRITELWSTQQSQGKKILPRHCSVQGAAR